MHLIHKYLLVVCHVLLFNGKAVVTVSGHTGNAANLAMNQVYEVKTVTSTTITILTGSGMTAATYNAGTIIVSLPEAREFS